MKINFKKVKEYSNIILNYITITALISIIIFCIISLGAVFTHELIYPIELGREIMNGVSANDFMLWSSIITTIMMSIIIVVIVKIIDPDNIFFKKLKEKMMSDDDDTKI